MKFLYSFVATRIVSLDGNTFGNLLPREFFTNSGPVDNAEKAFFRYKHKKTTWTLRSYETFENLNQNLAANSYGKLGCPVGNIV